jgi:polyhydroxyalkanoate synthase
MQLIQYTPLTPKVGTRPLVVVPPCINKFYIMDLQPDNSLIRFMVEQGNTVFLVSWRNPKEEQGNLTWEDYLEHGPIAALHVARKSARSSRSTPLASVSAAPF